MHDKPIKVLIGDDTSEFGIKLAGMLKDELGVFAYTRKKNGNAIYNSIINDCPEIVIVDLSLPDVDSVKIMNRIKNENIISPSFVIVMPIRNDFIERQLIEQGASYLVVEPYDLSEFCTVVEDIVDRRHPFNFRPIEALVTETIQRIGIPAHVKGYRYLRTAIVDAVDDASLMDSVTKQLYPVVASKHATTSTRVERAIRHAIGIAWNRGNFTEINKLFGYTIDAERGKPTNSEFIALITDNLRMRTKKEKSMYGH